SVPNSSSAARGDDSATTPTVSCGSSRASVRRNAWLRPDRSAWMPNTRPMTPAVASTPTSTRLSRRARAARSTGAAAWLDLLRGRASPSLITALATGASGAEAAAGTGVGTPEPAGGIGAEGAGAAASGAPGAGGPKPGDHSPTGPAAGPPTGPPTGPGPETGTGPGTGAGTEPAASPTPGAVGAPAMGPVSGGAGVPPGRVPSGGAPGPVGGGAGPTSVCSGGCSDAPATT